MAITSAQKKDLQRKASKIQKTFNAVKDNLSSSDRKSLSSSLSGANDAAKRLDKRSRSSNTPTITPESLQKQDVAEIPTPVVPTNKGLDLTSINAGLGAESDGMFKIAPITAQEGDTAGVTAAKDASNTIGSYLEQAMGLAKPEANASENALADARRQAGLDAAQQEFNRYSNQINAITAKRDADQLGLEGQGRGITDTIIGGQQARIGREAAIQALPIQAQLAAAQGNLEQAKELMGQLFTAKSADIQANQTYKTTLANSVMSWATSSQQAILQAKQADIAQQAQTAQANLAYQRQLGLQALEYGQNGLITGISSIDPNSPTFEAEMAAFTAKLRKPVAATSPKAPTTQVIDGQLYQYDYETGEWNLAVGAGGMSGDVEAAGGELDKISMIRDTIARITGRDADEEKGLEAYKPLYKKASQTPTSEFFGRTFTGSSGLDNLKVYADTLKSNMLTLAADPTIKDFFGPQMSNADVQQMMAVATRMQPDNQTPEQLLSETKRIESFIGKYEAAVREKMQSNEGNFGIPGAFSTIGSDGMEYIVVPDDYDAG